MKPSIAFLRKVADHKVMKVRRMRRYGAVTRFVGGEKTAQAHASLGLIKMPYIADIGRPSFAELTNAGREMLALEEIR